MWWFLLPGGVYYWMWRMTESLEIATGKRIKQVDTFLLYVVLSGMVLGSTMLFPDFSSADTSNELPSNVNWSIVLLIIFGVIAVIVLITILLHAVFITVVQNKLNKIRTNS